MMNGNEDDFVDARNLLPRSVQERCGDAKKLLTLVLLLALVLGSSSSSSPVGAPNQPTPPAPLTIQPHHYLLVLQWGLTYCQFHQCVVQPPREFTVHGLWPQNQYEDPPLINCYPYRDEFPDQLQLSEGLQDLPYVWINLIGQNKGLWMRSWIRHGSCTPFFTAVPQNLEGYFRSGLRFYNRLGLELRELQWEGINPTMEAEYATWEVLDAIKEITLFYPQVHCQMSEIQIGMVYLSDLRFCIDGLGELMDCPWYRREFGCGHSLILPSVILQQNTSLDEHGDITTRSNGSIAALYYSD